MKKLLESQLVKEWWNGLPLERKLFYKEKYAFDPSIKMTSEEVTLVFMDELSEVLKLKITREQPEPSGIYMSDGTLWAFH